MPEQSIVTLAKKTADYRRALMSMFASDLGPRVALDLMGIEHPTNAHRIFSGIVAETHRETLSRSELFLADEGMVELLDAAAPTMPDQELHLTDIMTPAGFVFFAEPLPDRSGQPPELPVHALSWAHLPKNHPLLSERDAPESVLITSYVLLADQAATLPGNRMLPPGAPRYLPNATVIWTVGTLIGQVFGDVPPPGRYTPGFYQRLLAAFWTLAQQPKMTSTSQTPPGRPTDIRKARRSGISDPAAPVHVIRLHHAEQTQAKGVPGEGDGRKVKVRFLVRGFWRRQFYPSIQSHRHIYIDPYMKGPANAPLQGGERVFLAHGPKTEKPEDQT